MSENLTLLKQRAAEDQTKHTEAVKEANARRAIATKELSIEMANLATSILVKHFGDLAVANLTVSQKSVNRLVDVLAVITHVEGFFPEFDFDFSVEGVHLSATAQANLTEKSYISLRLFHRITGVAQIDKVHTLDHAAIGDVETRNDADADGHNTSSPLRGGGPRRAASGWRGALGSG